MFSSLHLAIRPKTLIASLSPILIGTALAYSHGGFNFWIFLFTVLTGLGIQISTNFANDLYDFLKGADTPNRKGPVRVTQSSLLSVAQMKVATFAIMGATALSGTVLIARGGTLIAILVTLALVLAVAYTAGPYPIAYLGLAEFFILIFFGPVATGCTYYLQTLTFSREAFLIGLSPGLISCSLLIVNNLRDIGEDKVSNKKTLVARFGSTFGKWEYALSILIACTLPLFFLKRPLLSLLCFFPAGILIYIVFKTTDLYAYNPILGKTGKLLTLYTFIFCLSTIL